MYVWVLEDVEGKCTYTNMDMDVLKMCVWCFRVYNEKCMYQIARINFRFIVNAADDTFSSIKFDQCTRTMPSHLLSLTDETLMYAYISSHAI